MLAGTENVTNPEPYPVDLYTVGARHQLEAVRQITAPREGVFSIQPDLAGRIFVVYPGEDPTAVSIIHERHPTLNDTVTFRGSAAGSIPERTVFRPVLTAVGANSQSWALIILLRSTGPTTVSASLASIDGGVSTGNGRVAFNRWSQYGSLRWAGCPGGPTVCELPGARVANGRIFLTGVPRSVAIDVISESVLGRGTGKLWILGATGRLLAFSNQVIVKELMEKLPLSTTLYVHDRTLGVWKKIELPGGGDPRCRMFGSWLSSTVVNWNPMDGFSDDAISGAGDSSPGRDGERDWHTATLPNVRREYEEGVGAEMIIPGILLLKNLVDGRTITIDTGQEDSEILDVRSDGLVLYRVNDSIFSARIEGNKLSAPTLVVKDDDVPEVHWVFWSSAGVKAGSGVTAPAK